MDITQKSTLLEDSPDSCGIKGTVTYLQLSWEVEVVIGERGIVCVNNPGARQSRYISSRPYCLFSDSKPGSYDAET